MRWSEELRSGYYFRLLDKGLLGQDDLEPRIAGLEFYMEAFRELGSCRPMSMVSGPIPFTAIVEYFRLYGDGEFDDFLYVIRRMDVAFLEYQAKNSEKGSKSAPKRTSADNDKGRQQGKS